MPTTALPSSVRSSEASLGRRTWPFEARWLLTALAFPPAGYLASTVTAVDGTTGAIVGGAIAGAGIGAGQWLALRGSTTRPGFGVRWIGATAVAMAIGLALGAAAVGYRTGTADLVVMGLITGAVIGPAQAAVLRSAARSSRAGAVIWAAAVPVLWAGGWFVTASAGIDVERQYAVFGILGSLTVAAAGGIVLGRILRRTRR